MNLQCNTGSHGETRELPEHPPPTTTGDSCRVTNCALSIIEFGVNNHGECGIGSTDDKITTLTPVDLPDDVKGRVDRVVCNGGSSLAPAALDVDTMNMVSWAWGQKKQPSAPPPSCPSPWMTS